ncbi:MAG: CpsB/CapC family capsule biosynthesis tyrosine phosphatase [Cytophagaceae bacterium]
MSWFSSIFNKEKPLEGPIVTCDMHSHLLPGIDDGSDSIETSISLIESFISLGYKKAITTPHIMGDFFKNTPETIQNALDLVQGELKNRHITFEISAAAEYYLDEWFIQKLENDEPLLTLGASNYVLFETSYINRPSQLHQAIFLMKSKGYQPVLAHPERYTYMYDNFAGYENILQMGTLFQLNLNSLSGYYSKGAKAIAEKLIDNSWIHFVGTDCHGAKHINALQRTMDTKYYKKLQTINLLNNTL